MTLAADPPAAEMQGDADILLIDVTTDARHQALMAWKLNTPYLHEFLPDFHRLQLEHWIWTFKDQLAGKQILDIGAQHPRRWLGDGYRTFGNTEDVEADIKGDLLKLDEHGFGDTKPGWDAIICTEVLEHCADPILACWRMRDSLKDGGLLLVTSPFLWPDHHTEDYPDYFRFTLQGWELLLKDFKDVKITPVSWTAESKALLHLIRRFEGWGFKHHISGFTAYLAEAHT